MLGVLMYALKCAAAALGVVVLLFIIFVILGMIFIEISDNIKEKKTKAQEFEERLRNE